MTLRISKSSAWEITAEFPAADRVPNVESLPELVLYCDKDGFNLSPVAVESQQGALIELTDYNI